MSLFLGEKIIERGGKILLNYCVESVVQEEGKVVVRNGEGERIEGDYLVMAVPPPCLSKMNFTPSLSNERKLLSNRSFMGDLAKILILYP